LLLWLIALPVVLLVYGPLRGQTELSLEAALAGWIFYIALLPTVLAKTATGVLWAAERLELSASVSVLTTLVKTALGVIALFGGFGIVGLAVASLATNVVSASVDWYFARRTSLTEATPAANVPIAWLRESWPLFLNQLLQGLFFKIDALLMLPLAGDIAATAPPTLRRDAAAFAASIGAAP